MSTSARAPGIGHTDPAHSPGAGPVRAVGPAAPVEYAGLSGPGREPLLAFGPSTWRRVLFLLTNLPVGITGFVYVVTMVSLGSGLAITLIGLPLLALGLRLCRVFGRVERGRARWLLRLRIDEPSPRPRSGGLLGWIFGELSDPVSWRTALYLFIQLPWSIVTFVLTVLLLTVGWFVLPAVTRGLVSVDRAMIRALLSPSDAVERRIRELEADRGTVVDAAAADLRRIERDLHDGAQARLVALAMGLGLAKEKLADDPAAAARMVDEAHGEAKLAIQELRDLARGIHPAILTDRGLPAALSSLAARCTVPTSVAVTLDRRPAAALEGIVYFTVAELLTNISKHSGASTAAVELRRVGGRLMLRVWDDGIGGAAPGGGTGLLGLSGRVDAIDGELVVDSPVGGPTTVTAELPWRDEVEARATAR